MMLLSKPCVAGHARLAGGLNRLCLALLGAALCMGGRSAFAQVPPATPLRHSAVNPDGRDDLFLSTNLLRFVIEIPPDGVQVLQSGGSRRSQGKPEAMALVSEGGRHYTNVAVQLKGYTTFRSLDSLPSLTLDFNKHVPKQKFHGLTKLSLNNSLQDPTRLHEKFSRELFAAAGVPVPRADYALVTLNGRDLGLYVLTEGFDKEFLKRHFRRTDGTFYEGAILRDIDQSLQVKSGKVRTNDAAVPLIEASRLADPVQRLRGLEAVLDVDRFLSMVAVETILCHSDSYSMNRNNYRLYFDPLAQKLVFIPHGMDRVLGGHRSRLDLALVPPALGMVAGAILSTEEGRARYVERAATLFTNLWRTDELCRRVREIDAKILEFKTNEGNASAFDGRMSRGPTHDAEDLCQRIATRAALLRLQLADRGELVGPPPTPKFDLNGTASVEGWQVKPTLQSRGSCARATRDGKTMWHVRVLDGTQNVTLSSKMTLVAGSYRLAGQISCLDSSGATNAVEARLITHSSSRYAIEQRRLSSPRINVAFQVLEPRAYDEVEIHCEIRGASSELWFDPGPLRLIRETNSVPAASRPLRRL